MAEHKIGEVFDFEDKKIKSKITKDIYSCEGCFLARYRCNYIQNVEPCTHNLRLDGNDVIFVDVE